jgi:hypothetical protein
LLTSGPIVIPLLQLNANEPLGGHDNAAFYSMDLLAPVIHGGHWRFGEWTESYWSKLMGGNIHETSVYLGLSVLFLLGYAWYKRREIELEGLELWYCVLAVFFILALGPQLHIWGWAVPLTNWLPYRWLELIVPGMKVSGFPARMAVMLAFAAAVICAGAFKYLFSRPGWRQLAAFAILAVLVVEYLPKPIPSFVPIMPGHAGVLRGTPPGGGVLDASGEAFSYPRLATMSADQLADDMYGFTDAMYYQTFHRKPIAFGFMPRQPASVRAKDVEVAAALIGEQFDTLRNKFDIRYLAVWDEPPLVTTWVFLFFIFV